MIAGTVLMGLYQAAETAFPIALGLIVEHTMQDRSLGSLAISIGSLAVIITTVSLSWRFGMRVLQKANTTEAHRWRVRVAACGLQPVARDVDLKSGEILTIATEDADQTADIIEVVPLLISSLVAVAVAAVALSLADLRLGLLVIVGTVAILSVLAVMSKRIGASTQEQQARVARAGAKVADLIIGLRPLHGFGGNHAAFGSYRRVSTDAKRQAITVAKVNGVYGKHRARPQRRPRRGRLPDGGLAGLRGPDHHRGTRHGRGPRAVHHGTAQDVLRDAQVRDDRPRFGRAHGSGADRATRDDTGSRAPGARWGAGGRRSAPRDPAGRHIHGHGGGVRGDRGLSAARGGRPGRRPRGERRPPRVRGSGAGRGPGGRGPVDRVGPRAPAGESLRRGDLRRRRSGRTSTRRAPVGRSRRPSRPPCSPTSSPSTARGSTTRSATGARTSPEGSGNGSRWPARWPPTPKCSSCTIRRRPSTP